MTLADWVLIVNLAAVVVAGVAIVFGLRGVANQMRMTTFLTYTERYSKIMAALPFEARRPGGVFDLLALPEDERTPILAAYREYLNLCWEEWWLAETLKRIDPKTWKVWKQSIRETMDFPSWDEIWGVLSPEYEPYDPFVRFVLGIRDRPSRK